MTSINHPQLATISNNPLQAFNVNVGGGQILSLHTPNIDIPANKWYDASIDNNPATIVGATRPDDMKGLKFDGVDDSISAGNGTNLDTVGSFTYMFWMYHYTRVHGDYTHFQIIVSKNRDDTNGSKQFYWYSIANEYRFRIRWSDGSSTALGVSSADMPIQTWHHLGVGYDSDSKEMQAYLNGSEADTSPVDVSTKTPAVNTEAFTAGKLSGYSGFFFEGTIDGIMVYNLPPTKNTILSQYNQTKRYYQ